MLYIDTRKKITQKWTRRLHIATTIHYEKQTERRVLNIYREDLVLCCANKW